MENNYRNGPACDTLAVAISTIKHTGTAEIKDADVLIRAYHALLHEPPVCPTNCKWANGVRPQKCTCCARNYKNLKDCYERS